ncbi:hypothetical protein EMIT0347P_10362 [Pseudomonas sp. IT-347P]
MHVVESSVGSVNICTDAYVKRHTSESTELDFFYMQCSHLTGNCST